MPARTRLLIPLTAAAVAFALLGCSARGAQETAATPESTETQSVQPADGTVVVPSVWTGESLAQSLSISEMDAITDLNVFAQLPYADRLAFAIDKRADLATDDQGDSTPSLIPGFYWQNIDGTAMISADTLEGAKIISANSYYSTDLSTGQASEAYGAAAKSVLDNGGEGVSIANTNVFVASGQWQAGTDRDGHPIDFINITSYNADSHSGDRLGGDITDQAIRQQVTLLDGTIVIAYPRGYGIEGQQSPIEGGIY